jgi:O-antigen/teichoic acid export membrane protein
VIRGTAAFTAGAILQRAIVFLLLPFFTRILSPAEFGEIGVITALAAILSVVVALGLETAIFRGFKARANTPQAVQFVNTVGGFALVVPIMVATISMLAAPALSGIFDVPTNALRLASVGVALTTSATLVPLTLLRAQERLSDYLQLTALQVLVTPVLTIAFVAVFGWGVAGWMLAYALSSLVLLIRGLMILRHHWSLAFDVPALRDALAFGVPLVPHALSHWGLSVSDRTILGAYVPPAQVGAYYVDYLASLPVSLFAIAVSQATQPMFAEATTVEGRADIGRIITVQTVLIISLAAAIALVGPAVASLIFPTEFAATAGLIPWLAVGAGLFGLYLIPMNAISVMAGRTRRVWIVTLVAAAVNVGLNLVLVPRIGTVAAAVNTTIGYGLLLGGVFLYMRRVCDPPIPHDWKRIAIGAVVMGVSSAVAGAVIPPNSGFGLAARIAVIVAAAVTLLIGPFREEARSGWRAIVPRNVGGQA